MRNGAASVAACPAVFSTFSRDVCMVHVFDLDFDFGACFFHSVVAGACFSPLDLPVYFNLSVAKCADVSSSQQHKTLTCLSTCKMLYL